MRRSDSSGDETTHKAGRSLSYGKLVIVGFLCLILVVGPAGPVRGALTGAQGKGGPPSLVNFFPHDNPGSDIYTMEISALRRYNLGFTRDGVKITIRPGPKLEAERDGSSTNDVMLFRGLKQGGTGVVSPKRVGDGSATGRIEAGVLTDGGTPLLDGVNEGGTFAVVQVNGLGIDNFAMCGIAPFEDGMLAFGRTNDGDSPKIFFYPGVFNVTCEAKKIVKMGGSGKPTEVTTIRARETGTRKWDTIQKSTRALLVGAPDELDQNSAKLPQHSNVTFGVANLDLGPDGMYFDNVVTSGISGDAEQTIIDLINKSFDLEESALAKLDSDPALAQSFIEDARIQLFKAETELRGAAADGALQRSTKVSKALKELQKADANDGIALLALLDGNKDEAVLALADALNHKARAELFLQGHNPVSGPIPDGKGGHDEGDAPFLNIFSDGFESGDTSAWSIGTGR